MRKPTTIVHIGLGVLTALVALQSIGLATLLFSSFGVYEYWSERHGHAGGYDDFWEALLGLAVACVVIVAAGFMR